MDNINCVKRKIEETIKESLVPEDLIHSKNTLEWLLKLNPAADAALQIAALGHGIERAIEGRKIKREDFKNYDEFKDAHALNSAKVMTEVMKECNISKRLADDIFSLVRYHETGNTKRIDILRDADSISFFHVNLTIGDTILISLPRQSQSSGFIPINRDYASSFMRLPSPTLKKSKNTFYKFSPRKSKIFRD